MGFDWKAFATAFMQGQATDIKQRGIDAREYEKEQKALADKNAALVQRKRALAQQAASIGKRAMSLMDDSIPLSEKEAIVATAMSSGPTGVEQLYTTLEKASTTRYNGRKLTKSDMDAVMQMPDIMPEMSMSLDDFAMQTYGAALPSSSTTAPAEKKDLPMGAVLMGFGQQAAAEERLNAPAYGGMSVNDINRLAAQADYTSLFEGSYMTFAERPYMSTDAALNFNTAITKEYDDFLKSEEADKVRSNAADAWIKANPGKNPTDPEGAAFIERWVKTAALDRASVFIDAMVDEYGESFFSNNVAMRTIDNLYGKGAIDGWKKEYGFFDPENTEEDTTPSAFDLDGISAGIDAVEQESADTKEAVKETLETGDVEKVGDSTEDFTREEWEKMSRSEREKNGLPVSTAGGWFFRFKGESAPAVTDTGVEQSVDYGEFSAAPEVTVDVNVEEQNLAIFSNPTKENYKIYVRGRLKPFNLTKEQIALIPEVALRGHTPTIRIEEYEDGEKLKTSITSNRLTSITTR